MKNPKEELEAHYAKEDPWGYKTNPDDIKRKDTILKTIKNYGAPFDLALDIGCGEGFITKDIQAKVIHGFELSDTAKSRVPEPVILVDDPKEKYDLIVATGVLYNHYDYVRFIKMINDLSSGIIITCNIETWEVPNLKEMIKGKQLVEARFAYREFRQKLRVFRK